jgi:hypothetical protein
MEKTRDYMIILYANISRQKISRHNFFRLLWLIAADFLAAMADCGGSGWYGSVVSLNQPYQPK